MLLLDENIKLRAIERSDNPVLKALLNDPETEAHVVGWSFPSSDERQSQWYERITQDMDSSQFRYTVELDGKCVGMVGLHDIDYKNSTAKVDIKLVEVCRGQGVGTRVMKLLVAYAFDELNLHCLIAEILEENQGSRRMHEKAGFRLDGILRNRVYKGGQYHHLCVYSVLKDEYEGQKSAAEKKQ